MPLLLFFYHGKKPILHDMPLGAAARPGHFERKEAGLVYQITSLRYICMSANGCMDGTS